MEIKDIIKSDADRLFIVDPECYIIFTGESTNDVQPFIRIGNWTDMPVELIPLIENIIVTDNLVGNPSHEQFNIDIRYLSTNRYIGSRGIVAKFLDFQKIFGLDLTNASVVDIEKDLPVLSAEKNISHKDQFIGVFYRDGNFKVLLNKNTIFDLNSITKKPITNGNFHDILSDANKNSERYRGSGLVIAGHNPIFYHNKHYYPYLFPDRYFRDFSVLGIDPGKIQTLFYPSLNLVNISKLFKWLNHSQKMIRIFTNTADIALVKKIFSNVLLKNYNFSTLNFKTGTGLTVKNYQGSYNLKLHFESVTPAGDGLTAAFIKGSSGVKAILKEKLDALLISYTAFEDINMLLKSTGAPYAIIDDGNRNILKLGGKNRIILRPGLQYEFRKFNGFDDVIEFIDIDDEKISQARSDPEALAGSVLEAMKNEREDFAQAKNTRNLLALVRIHLANTKNRKIAARLNNAAAVLEQAAERNAIVQYAKRCKIILAVYNDSMIQAVTDLSPEAVSGHGELFDDINDAKDAPYNELSGEVKEHYDRVIADRTRLRQLIAIYVASEQYNERNRPGLDKLTRAIASRKEQYFHENLSLERPDSRPVDSAARDIQDRSDIRDRGDMRQHPELDHRPVEKKNIRRSAIQLVKTMPVPVKIGLPVIMILIAAAVLMLFNSDEIATRLTTDETRIVQSRELDTQFRELGKKHNIRIRDNDILNYANQVAVKNGYHKIAETKFKEKNPDWIYPNNIFIMLDGQRVTVSKGDTLWNLSKNKLIESSIEFNGIMNKANASGAREKIVLIEQARKHAFTREQQEQIKKAAGDLPKDGTGHR